MKTVMLGALGSFVLTALLSLAPASAEAGYYSSYSYYPSHNYYLCNYHYGNRYHYVVYYPSRPRYLYYYNPYRRTFWGRYDLEQAGYSLLPEDKRKGTINAIPETDFPAAGEMPAVPDATDGSKVEVPTAPPQAAGR